MIADSGIGIKEDDLDKVFQEFYQVDNKINSAGGSGIGLSFAKNIVELHGGELEIESNLGHGTEVIFCLKGGRRASQTTTNDLPEKQEIVKLPISKKHNASKPAILVVEDHTEMMEYLEVLLTPDYCIYKAVNGEEALSVVGSEKVDFIITDYMMPKMNGAEFIGELRHQGYETPVIVLTARTDIETKLDVLRMGIDDYLHKPFNSDELLIKIENRLKNYSEARAERDLDFKTRKTSEFIADVSAYIDENCEDLNFRIERICLHFGYSESSLFRKVKSETGLSPKGLIKEVRFLKARKMLEAKKVDSLKSLAFSVGLKNTSYFKRQYYERFGSDINELIE